MVGSDEIAPFLGNVAPFSGEKLAGFVSGTVGSILYSNGKVVSFRPHPMLNFQGSPCGGNHKSQCSSALRFDCLRSAGVKILPGN